MILNIFELVNDYVVFFFFKNVLEIAYTQLRKYNIGKKYEK